MPLLSSTLIKTYGTLLFLLLPLISFTATAQEVAQDANTASPAEKFIELWENRIERSVTSRSEVEARLLLARKDVAEQEKRLTTEINEANGIEDLIGRLPI